MSKETEPPNDKVAEEEIVDETIVDYELNDPENPKNWSPLYKWSIVALLSMLALT